MNFPTDSTATLASFASSLDPGAIPPATIHAAARLLLDTLGCMLGGSDTTVGRISRAWVDRSVAPGRPRGGAGATIAGTDRRTAPLFAGYVNARAAAVLDADETYPSDRQTSHLAAATVATAMAVVEHRRGTKADLLAAIVAGYEVGARISDSMVPAEGNAGRGLRAGWGPGSVLGATAAAGRAASLAPGPLAHAIGIAGTHIGPPPLQWADGRPASMAKTADAGWHAMTAIAAAGMAALDATGYDRILDGERGLWRALGYAAGDAAAATDRLGVRWIVAEATFKRWPCQYWMHPALTALWRILEEEDIHADEIDGIELATNDKSMAPRFADPEPAGEIDRAFSFPHAAAMLVLHVPAGPGWSDEARARDPTVRRLRRLVRVERHPDADRVAEWVVDHQIRELPARATIHARGTTHVVETRFGLGNPWSEETSLSDDVLVEKFLEMTTSSGSPEFEDASRTRRDAIVRWALAAPLDAPIRDLTALLHPTRPVSPPEVT
jgi:2-methylcitrate dehydratase PrpD